MFLHRIFQWDVLGVQWLRIQRAWVQSLVWEGPTRVEQLSLHAAAIEPVCLPAEALQQEKPAHSTEEEPQLPQLEKAHG